MQTLELGNKIYDALGFRFSLLGSGNEVAYGPTNCKEYILDTFQSSLLGTNPYYGRVPTDSMRLLICGPRDGSRGLLNCTNEIWPLKFIDYIRELEARAHIPPTEVFQVKGTKTCFVFKIAQDWYLAPPLLSFYAAVARVVGEIETFDDVGKRLCGTFDIPIDKFTGRKVQFRKCDAGPFITTLVERGARGMFGDDLVANWTLSSASVHGCGIMSYIAGHLKQHKPYWHDLDTSSNAGIIDSSVATQVIADYSYGLR